MDSISYATLETFLTDGEGSSDRVLKRSRSLDPDAFHYFSRSLCVGRLYSYFSQLNANSPPRDANVPYLCGPIYILSWEYRQKQS